MKIKYISMLLLGVTLGLTSCDDYLDKEPESNVTPASFFTSADDLAAYTVNLYGALTGAGVTVGVESCLTLAIRNWNQVDYTNNVRIAKVNVN